MRFSAWSSAHTVLLKCPPNAKCVADQHAPCPHLTNSVKASRCRTTYKRFFWGDKISRPFFSPERGRIGAFFSIFRALQGLRSAFLCTANFCTISGFFWVVFLHILQFILLETDFMSNFDEIFVEFWRNFVEIWRNLTNCVEICRNLSNFDEKFVKNWKRIRQKTVELIRQFDILAVEQKFVAS